MELLVWAGILICVTQSASLSGLNLAVFSISRLRLEALASGGDAEAERVLRLRRDANVTLATILVANVAVNVLLTLLAESIMAGVLAFLFSTVVITFGGEILPQAYMTRHALRVVALLAPLLHVYRVVLWPVARPVGKLLDRWVGPEGVPWYREAELEDVLRHHARHAENEVSRLEATGAINFLALDDIPVAHEGEPLDRRSVIAVPFRDGRPEFPAFSPSPEDPFLRELESSGMKWVVVTDPGGVPRYLMDAHRFLRGALFAPGRFEPLSACHRPILVGDETRPLGAFLTRLTVVPESPRDDVVDDDVILLWTPDNKRVISGSDILGRLLRGIARVATGAADSAPMP